MALINFDIPEPLNKKVAAYSVASGINDKRKAVIDILDRFFNKNPNIINKMMEEENEI